MNSKGGEKMKCVSRCFCLAAVFILFLTSPSIVVASPATRMNIEPRETLDIQPNGTFNVNVTVTDVTELYGWAFNMTFNPAVLNIENVTEGPFLKQAGITLFAKKTDYTIGYLAVSAAFVPPNPAHGVNGSGVLSNIVFKVMSQGSSTLHFEKLTTKLRTVTAGNVVAIDFEAEDGSFRNVAAGLSLPLEFVAGAIVIVAVGGVGGFVYFRRRKRLAEEEEEEAETETSEET